ncbi:carbon-nitrogen hydrolase family protein [Paenibacillus hamazuiensis]|uniref:carbon-nitrogen hydrolase family protein n=1 Tax=Paenibacillus hamazuiensis TaxID=2936508 RepID=UPI0020109614
MKVAAVQMDCLLGSKGNNLEKADRLLQQAVEQGAKLIVLPELFNTGYRVEERDPELAETVPGETTEWLERICRTHQVYIVGCILEKCAVNGVVYDTAFAVGPEGFIGSYRKTHLWDKEHLRFAKGWELPVFDLGFARLGLQICYEIGFPEGARSLTLQGADIIAYPSAFGKERYYAWDVASRSRALENGVYVIACNRTGTEKNETEFGGKSRIVDPTGKVLAEAEATDEVIVSEIDLDFVAVQRRKIPYLRDLNRQLMKDVYHH